ncbi:MULTISPECIES: LysM peptidoglycan-binding domain-containing protein [Microbacterium]|uniref:Peptidase M23 n=1 Tax=Microbacterium wangchenii TaxID=2541726 RepID=A0ABX5SSQ1_9MICO|nr:MULTISPECIES: LysM peptidoglycan-binding domain-containing protein [Microbacterium]MCK6067922.1 LysM peptidoglycan-binding domain-containing protein [Microbacterium sp. EYE_512]QBR89193.1 peptidase M23 [Microbacterium wangchenii]
MPLTSTSSDTSKLEHARIDVHEPGPEPGKLGPFKFAIDFQFNPRELTMAKTAKWEKKNQNNSGAAGPVTYLGPDAQKLTVEMYLDASKAQDEFVVKSVERLFETCLPTARSKTGGKPSAPWVRFMWGTLSGFVGYVTSVSARYTLFSPDGRPLRAVCTVALEEFANPKRKQNPTSGGIAPRRSHVVREGDSLPLLAYREYGNAELWREVAEANGIDDPLRLRPGTVLLLPSATEMARAATRGRTLREVLRAH